ncbi:MAG: 8-hydroxy-5-deazaflavin:NADPH oxidoreductase [Actinomycetota bacterium]|nr:8-hydroxy-5-deazaflavin:NADPH oxidoreductase [Actinomycetota bacterium]
MTTLGTIGAGSIGSNVARAALTHGHDVVLSNSRGPDTLGEVVSALGTRARAGTVQDAASEGDVVLVAIPLKNYRSVPAAAVGDKIVIDADNYYPQRDGHIPELDDERTTSAELLQAHLPEAKVVKTFNHIQAAQIVSDGTPPGTPDRRALAIAGDDQAAKDTVAALLDEFGFDVVDAGPLAEGWRFQPDTPAYGARQNAEQTRANLAAARRHRDM